MQVGDLVRHIRIKHSRQVGVITQTKSTNRMMLNPKNQKYKVLWACTQTEEYWFTAEEVGLI